MQSIIVSSSTDNSQQQHHHHRRKNNWNTLSDSDMYKSRIFSLAVIGVAIALWCVNFFGIEEYHRVVDGDFGCSNGDDLASLQYSQLVRKVNHNTSRPEDFTPRVLHYRHHVLIAHYERVEITTTQHAYVIRLLQNSTALRAPHLRDVLRTGRSAQWRTLRTFDIVNSTEMVGPVHLAETPDGSGVVVASAFVKHKRKRGFAMFVSSDDNLDQWRSVIHESEISESETHHRTLDIVNLSPAFNTGEFIRVSVTGTTTTTQNQQLLLVQRFRSVDSLLSAAPYQCPSCVKSCGDGVASNSNLTELTVQLPLGMAMVVSATVVPSVFRTPHHHQHGQRQQTDGIMHVFVRSQDGSIMRVDVDLAKAADTACPATATSPARAPTISITKPGERPLSDFRILQFNAKRFSVKTPNFSLFMAASRHTNFNTLHTSLEDAHKLQVVKLAWSYSAGGDGDGDSASATAAAAPSAFALCSPILMNMGGIRGLHTTQIAEDTVLAIYTRQFRGITSLHLANIYVGNAHVAN